MPYSSKIKSRLSLHVSFKYTPSALPKYSSTKQQDFSLWQIRWLNVSLILFFIPKKSLITYIPGLININ